MHLDEDKLEALRHWGEGLQETGGEQSAAAGRAILMLIAEIEQLHVDLRLVREQLSRVGPPLSDEAAGSAEEELAPTLNERLHRVLRRDSNSSPRPQSAEEPASGMGTDETTATPQAWIDALRRHG